MKKAAARHPETLLTHLGRNPAAHFGTVNTPVHRASTLLFDSVEAYQEAGRTRLQKGKSSYGRTGTPTTFAFEETVAALEGGYGAVAVSSGLQAVAVVLMSFATAGAHLLLPDSVYFPARRICQELLQRLGVETTYYDPTIGTGIAGLIRDNTALIYLESPGSLTFEVQDVPAVAAAAHAAGALVVLDNTWATPLFFKPFHHGVDISIHAATKYIGGHSDLMLGLIVTGQDHFKRLKGTAHGLGFAAAPDDCYLGLRGFRTLSVRLRRHQETGLALARWLQTRPEVAKVLHPALPETPGHAFWKRDFTGASGLFSVVLKPYPKSAVAAMVDGMTLFPLGFSWGGYESLILPAYPQTTRSATRWSEPGPLLRLHAGLEDPQDLIADLARGFDRLNAAAQNCVDETGRNR